MNKLSKVADDIECARDWLLPGREVKQIEIDKCIQELHDIIVQLRKLAAQDKSAIAFLRGIQSHAQTPDTLWSFFDCKREDIEKLLYKGRPNRYLKEKE